MIVSESVSKFFKDQVIGSHNGHMSLLPNNPTLQGLAMAHGADKSDEDFAKFLRAVADWIDGGGHA